METLPASSRSTLKGVIPELPALQRLTALTLAPHPEQAGRRARLSVRVLRAAARLPRLRMLVLDDHDCWSVGCVRALPHFCLMLPIVWVRRCVHPQCATRRGRLRHCSSACPPDPGCSGAGHVLCCCPWLQARGHICCWPASSPYVSATCPSITCRHHTASTDVNAASQDAIRNAWHQKGCCAETLVLCKAAM
jgi:hypothetical protein